MCATRTAHLIVLDFAGFCEQDNEPFGSIKGRKFIYLMSDYQLLKEDSSSFNERVKERVR
jgi:hypothetical protein